MNIAWIKWKAGLIVAIVSGALTGLIGITVDNKLSWKVVGVLAAVSAAKDMVLYLKDHPIENALDNK